MTAFREQFQSKGRVRNFELDLRAKDGTVRTVLLSSELIDIDGVPHAMSAGVDITDEKRAKAELEKLGVENRNAAAMKAIEVLNRPI